MRNFERWLKEYHEKKIINFYKDLSQDDIDTLKKLGIVVKEELYTEYEFEVLNMELVAYYEDNDMDEEELETVKPLENTGVTRERYNQLLKKINNLEIEYSKSYSKLMITDENNEVDNEISKLKERANKIIGNREINTLIEEADMMKILIECSNKVDNTNYIIYAKILDAIELYLIEKEKMRIQEKDMVFLSNLAKELREQQVRIADNSNPPLFIVKNEIGQEVYFLTRNALEKYSRFNLKNTKKIVEIPSNRSIELSELLDIIKRNF